MGDMLAGHFTALAFVGLLISIQQMHKSIQKQDEAIQKQDEVILIQREEMQLQREEMQLQRGEMTKANEITNFQIRLIEKQNFEYTFFNMLTLYSQAKESMKIHNGKQNQDNTDAFSIMFGQFAIDVTEKLTREKQNFFTVNEIKYEYLEFYKTAHIHLSQYFRVLYRTIQYVDVYEDNYKQIDKLFYIKLLRARLSSVEIFFLFLNGLTEDGKNFKKLIEKYELLEHLVTFRIFDKFDSSILNEYDIKAYGKGALTEEENIKNTFFKLE